MRTCTHLTQGPWGGEFTVGLVFWFVLNDGWGEDTADFWGWWFAGHAAGDEGRGVGWFFGGSGVARPQPRESDGGGATDSVEKIDVLGFFLVADGFCSNVACLVVAVDETITLGEPTGAHPSVLAPSGSVLR